jgi:integrase
MPKQVSPLTNTQVKNAKAKPKEYNLADGNGLYLRVKSSGSKLWVFNYQAPFSKRRSNISFGTFPPVTLAQARSERAICRELLAKDVDPKHARAERDDAQAIAYANTLEVVARKWFKSKSKKLTDKYADDLLNSLQNHVFPKLGKRPIHKITAREVIEVLEPLQESGKLELVKRICQRLNMIMDYAVASDIVSDNRLVRMGKAFESPDKVHLPTVSPDELPALVKAIEKASIKPVTRFLTLWQLHTMVRPSEASGARWDEIDLKNKVWNISSERMKKRREHSVPLTDQTLAILKQIKSLTGNREFIFPSDIDPRNRPINSSSVNMALRRMGYKGKLVSHGLRSLASTTLNEQGFDPDLIEASLAHLDKNATRAAYNRTDYLERRKSVMQWWSDHIEQAAMGNLSLSSNVAFLNTGGR